MRILHEYRLVLTTALVLAGVVSDLPAQTRQITVHDVIGWLPENIETLVVAKGPAPSIDRPEAVVHLLGLLASDPLSTYQKGEPSRELTGARLQFAILGARAFRAPNGLGGSLYDGCNVLVFEPADTAGIDRFMRRLSASGGVSARIGETDATRVSWVQERDSVSALVVRHASNVVLVATAQEMLVETLDRIRNPRSARAMPAELPEWSAVDTTARVWAIRHYKPDPANRDPSTPLTPERRSHNEPDTMAVGATLSVSDGATPRAIVHYFSRNPEVTAIATRWWRGRTRLISTIERGVAGSVRITPVPPPNSQDGWSMIFVWLAATLGYAIFI